MSNLVFLGVALVISVVGVTILVLRSRPPSSPHSSIDQFHDKMRALDILAKHFKLYADSKEITGPGGGPLQVQAVDTKEVLENLSPEALAELETAIKHATARETATDVEDFD